MALLQQAATHRRWVTKDCLASFIGYVGSLSLALPYARFHLLPLYDSLHAGPLQWGPHVHTRLTSGAMRKLKFYFLRIPPEDIGAPIAPVRPSEAIFTDASRAGWGGYLHHHYLADVWHAPLS